MTTSIEQYDNYVFPKKNIHDNYKYETRRVADNGWGNIIVTVFRKSPTAEFEWEKITEYARNYSMLDTFHVFQQKRDGVWHDYALISTRYTRVEVMDLETGEIIAVEPYPVVDAEWAERYPENKVGDERPGWGFCPSSFYVPDWWDEYDESFTANVVSKNAKNPEFEESYAKELLNEFAFFEGNWAVYSGCLWGDDTSEKVRYIDLSRISEGILTTDERFGYIQLPDGEKLSSCVKLQAGSNRVMISTPVYFDLETGKGQFKEMFINAIKWADDES